jgi:catechol 2,3-dioxygenase-like lactoylglutathione lyase family enzyme
MGRLHCVLLLTPDVARQRAFYETQLGLEVARAEETHVGFAARGSALVLRPVPEGGKAELRLAITATPLETRLGVTKSRGAVSEGEIGDDLLGRMALLRDPEGNGVQLVEPSGELAPGRWPRMSYAIVSASKFDDTVAFYREVVGLKVADEDDQRVEFDTGETKLVIYDRLNPNAPQLPADQRIAFAFEDAELEAWTGELRGRGVGFAASPAETELGLQVEVEDGDGWFVVLHGPEPDDLPDEDELSAEYGGGGDDDRGLPRRGGEISGGGDGRKFIPAAKLARKQAARASKAPAPELDRGGFVPRSPRPYTPRPDGPPRPYTPRPDGPPRSDGPSRPYTPRPEGASPRPYTPRPDGPPRPYTPRPDGPRSGPPREGGSRPYTPRPDGPRPAPRPSGPPRPDRDRSE